MLATVHNMPSLLIPKELFREEKIGEYWGILQPVSQIENIGKDELGDFFLLYPKPNKEDSNHEIFVLFNQFLRKFPKNEHAICINVHEDGFSLLVIKERNVLYTGYFRYIVKEDVLYHLANISQHFFEDINQIVFAYQQIPTAIIRLLENYYEMKKI